MGGHSGLKSDLLTNMSNEDALAKQYGAQAAQEGAVLTPALESEAINPQGYTPTQMAAQTTAAEQTAGGSNSGATGGALLRAARTRNAGAAPAVTSAAGRASGEELSQINAGIQGRNADLQQRQRQQGLSGLAGVYGENVGAGENALGLSNSSLADAGNLQNYWQKLLSQGIDDGTYLAGKLLDSGGNNSGGNK